MIRRPFVRTSAVLAGLPMALKACNQTPRSTPPSGAGTSTTEPAPAPTFATLKYAPKIPEMAALLERKEDGPDELVDIAVSGKMIVSVRHDFKARSSELVGHVPGEAKTSWKKTADGWIGCVGDSSAVCPASNYEDGEWSVGDPHILNPASGWFEGLSVGPAGTFQFVDVCEEVAYFPTWSGTKNVHVTGFDVDGAPVADKNLRVAVSEVVAPETKEAERRSSASVDEKASPTHRKASPSAATKRPKIPRALSASPSNGDSSSRTDSSGPPSDATSPLNGPSSNGILSGTPPQKKSAYKPAARPPASRATRIRAQMAGSYPVMRTDSMSSVYFTRGNRFVRKDFDGTYAAFKDGVVYETESGLIGVGARVDDARELEADMTILSSAVKSNFSFVDAEAGMHSRLNRASGASDVAPSEDAEASALPTQSHDAGSNMAGEGTAGEGPSTGSSDAAHPLPLGRWYLASGPRAPILLSTGDGELSINSKRSAAIGETKVKGVDFDHDIAVASVETHGKSVGESKAPVIVSSILVDGDGAAAAGIDKARTDQLSTKANGGGVLRPYGFAWQGSCLVYTNLTKAVIGVYRTAEEGK